MRGEIPSMNSLHHQVQPAVAGGGRAANQEQSKTLSNDPMSCQKEPVKSSCLSRGSDFSSRSEQVKSLNRQTSVFVKVLF